MADLKAAGLSQSQVAEACGCGQATLSELAGGRISEPRHALGERLLSLWRSLQEPAGSPPTPQPQAKEA